MTAMWSTLASGRGWLVALAIFFVVSLLFWGDCLVGPYAPLAATFQAQMEPWRSEADLPAPQYQWYPLLWDGVAQFYPWRLLAARELRAGRFALWNPHQFCGYPIVGNGQSALFYPPNWLLALVDVRWGMGLLAALHSLLSAWLTYLFARRIGIAPLAAVFSGLAFAWGGFMVGWAELPSVTAVATWLPGALLGVAMLFDCDRRGVPVLALSLALTLLAGHFQVAAYVWFATIVYAAGRALWEKVNGRAWHPAALATSFALAVLIGSVQAVPSFELAFNSTRGTGRPTEEGFEFHRARALQPEELPALLRPNLFGNPAHADYVLAQYGLPYAEHCGFVGIITVLLAVVGMAVARSRHYAFFLILSAVTLNIAMCGPLARAMYFGIPKLGLAGSFTRVLVVYTFAMALAGAAGLDGVMRWLLRRTATAEGRNALGWRGVRFENLIGIIAIVVLAYELLPWAHDYLPKTRREHIYPVTPTIRRLATAAGRVLAVTPRESWSMVQPPQALLPPNSATVYGYDSVSGYDSLFPLHYRRFVLGAEGEEPAPLENGNMLLLQRPEDPLYAVAGLRTVATMRDGGAAPGVSIATLPGALPRAFVVPNGPDWIQALENAIANGTAKDALSNAFVKVRACQWRRTAPGVLVVTDVSGDGPAPWLIVSETFHPGWRAYVDGAPRDVVQAGPFCAVALRGDEGECYLVFEPDSVRIGLFSALVGVGALVGLAMFGRAFPTVRG